MIRISKLSLLLGCIISSGMSLAESGAVLSIPVIPGIPEHLKGYRIAAWHQPSYLIWQKWRVFFDVSAGHWWTASDTNNRSINIIALAPTLRYYFHQSSFSPFIDLSIGPAYLSRTRIDHRNLGMHFAFQDQAGIGALFGTKQKLMLSVSALHYSNGSLCGHNSGITIPFLLNIGYRFS